MWMLALWTGCATSGLEVRVANLEQRVRKQDALIKDLSERVISKREREEATIVGKEAKLVVTEWLQGEDRLEDHEATLLVFFEAWCPHCKREVPLLQQKLDAYGPRLGVIGVTRLNRDTSPKKMEKFLSDNDVGYPIARDDGTMTEHYAVSGVPAAALVKGGKVVWRGHPSNLNDGMIEASIR